MTNFTKRLILTLVAVPIAIFILFWPMDTHIFVFIIFWILITILGSYEINSLIYHKGIKVKRYYLPIINSSILIASYLYANNFFNIQNFKLYWIFFAIYIITIISSIYARDIFKQDLTYSFEKMSYTLFGMLYIGIPSFFMPFIFNISKNPKNPIPIFYNIDSTGTLTGSLLALFFIVLVWSNDIFAYVFGMAFGRNNVIKLAASPKKSWAGYIGGYLSTFVFVTIFYFLFDRFIKFDIWFYFGLPFITGILVPIGDLVESVVKRSANVKDSGNIIAGRGGILDSVDTILYLLPIYFLLIQLYFAIKSL
ncbi:MAG TPA: phosphatidate cytidylyltransferase [Spirochaetota bacterium]|nr:phosphatidate cytidylyltransferase [Spirochaetota bacterium]HOL57665.1 phosphatidate cytidylyltransferase [Spirochaetota bacterium]HPP04755.1 phosphatidate cytidylyltransferase [Spirochaetota bacterium]